MGHTWDNYMDTTFKKMSVEKQIWGIIPNQIEAFELKKFDP